MDQLIGRVDLLEIIDGRTAKQSHLDLQVILNSSRRQAEEMAHYKKRRNNPFDEGVLNAKILEDFNKKDNSLTENKIYKNK